MITNYLKIRRALVSLLKNKFPSIAVHLDNVDKSDAPYFYIEFTEKVRTLDRIYAERHFMVDVVYYPVEDEFGRVKRSELHSISEELDETIRPVLKVEDRFFTILDAEKSYVDEILHYIFYLDFVDAIEDINNYELMQELELNINKEE